MVHNYYQQRGGEDISTESEVALLRANGHHIEFYTVHNDLVKSVGRLLTAIRSVWSLSAYKDIRKILSLGSYDILHVQNTFPLISPSILYAAKAEKVPVVMSVRNFRLFCLNGFFHDGNAVCEMCLGKFMSLPGIIRRCYRNSLFGSLTVAVIKAVHFYILKSWKRQVNGYIALSQFVKEKIIEGGFDETKIYVKPNFVFADISTSLKSKLEKRNYLVYAGRLSAEKGIQTMMDAFKKLNEPGLELFIIGDGPLMEYLEKRKQENVIFLGHKSHEELLSLISSAKGLIFPSEWYETFGRVVIEAYNVGTPVVGSNLGAISEIIVDGKTGFLFEAGNADSLKASLERLIQSDLSELSNNCVEYFKMRFSSDHNIEMLLHIYDEIISKYNDDQSTSRFKIY